MYFLTSKQEFFFCERSLIRRPLGLLVKQNKTGDLLPPTALSVYIEETLLKYLIFDNGFFSSTRQPVARILSHGSLPMNDLRGLWLNYKTEKLDVGPTNLYLGPICVSPSSEQSWATVYNTPQSHQVTV